MPQYALFFVVLGMTIAAGTAAPTGSGQCGAVGAAVPAAIEPDQNASLPTLIVSAPNLGANRG